jgi:outer membrane protein assembly factor BamB
VHQTGIHALAAATGASLWTDPRNSVSLASSPTALDGELYVSSNSVTTRYRGDTGEKVWTASGCCSPNDRAPSVDATRVYAGNVCTPLSRATGQPVPGYTDRCLSDDHAAVPLYRGHLLADLGRGRGTSLDFDVERGVVVGGAGSSFPAAVIGNVLLTSDVYNVTAREFPGGTPRWNWYAGPMYNDIVMPPLLVGRTVYVVLDQPGLRAIDLDTGKVVFSQSLGLEFPERYTAGSPAALAVGEGLLLIPTPRGLMAFESA